MINDCTINSNIIYAEYAVRVTGAAALIATVALIVIVGLALADKLPPIFMAYSLGALVPICFVQVCIQRYQIDQAKKQKINLKAAFENDHSHQFFVQPFITKYSDHKAVYHD